MTSETLLLAVSLSISSWRWTWNKSMTRPPSGLPRRGPREAQWTRCTGHNVHTHTCRLIQLGTPYPRSVLRKCSSHCLATSPQEHSPLLPDHLKGRGRVLEWVSIQRHLPHHPGKVNMGRRRHTAGYKVNVNLKEPKRYHTTGTLSLLVFCTWRKPSIRLPML